MSFLDGTILDDQSIPLGAVTTEDGGAIEGEIQGLGEGYAWIAQESNLLAFVSMLSRCRRDEAETLKNNIRRSSRKDQVLCPTPSCC
jgi:hypothetical protein